MLHLLNKINFFLFRLGFNPVTHECHSNLISQDGAFYMLCVRMHVCQIYNMLTLEE